MDLSSFNTFRGGGCSEPPTDLHIKSTTLFFKDEILRLLSNTSVFSCFWYHHLQLFHLHYCSPFSIGSICLLQHQPRIRRKRETGRRENLGTRLLQQYNPRITNFVSRASLSLSSSRFSRHQKMFSAGSQEARFHQEN